MTNTLTRVKRLEAILAPGTKSQLIVMQANSSEDANAVLGDAGFDLDDPSNLVVRIRHFGPNKPDPTILYTMEMS